MINIKNTDLITLNNKFSHFARESLNNKKTNAQYVSSQLKRYENQYKKINALESFIENTSKLLVGLENRGLTDIAGIIYSGLVKIPTLTYETKEDIILKGLKNAKNNGDNVHALARIVDLKYLYKNCKAKKKFIKTLFEEEKILKSIVDEYEKNKSAYRTVARSMSSIEKYNFKLATSKVDLGKALLRTNPEMAYAKLEEAQRIFLKQKKNKEADFVSDLIQQILEQGF